MHGSEYNSHMGRVRGEGYMCSHVCYWITNTCSRVYATGLLTLVVVYMLLDY